MAKQTYRIDLTREELEFLLPATFGGNVECLVGQDEAEAAAATAGHIRKKVVRLLDAIDNAASAA